MRLFLGLILFDMIFHSVAALWPYKEWCWDFEIATMPQGLPGPEERERLRRAGEEAGQNLLNERVMSSFDSLWEFWRPWPGPATRKRMEDAEDAAKVSVGWLTTRLDFLEHLIRQRQRWTMFSPNVSNHDDVVRARLVFADGSTETVRTIVEPADVLHYESFRFVTEKRLQCAVHVHQDEPYERLGLCNLLAHQRPHNAAGSPLKTIHLIVVRYNYPGPGEDVRAALEAQKVPLGQEQNEPFYEYDVSTRKGRELEQGERK